MFEDIEKYNRKKQASKQAQASKQQKK